MTGWVLGIMMSITGILCMVAVFSKAFEDNFLQRIGLGILSIAEFIRAAQMFQGIDIVILFQWIHFAMFCFALGTFWKFALRKWFADHYPNVHINFPYDRRKDHGISTHL